jgi:hypothetical protein
MLNICCEHILRLTISGKDYVLFICMHRAHACKRSLAYGRILFKFAVNILQVTSISMGCVLFMFTHRVFERACASARVVKHSLIFRWILFKVAGHILQMTTSYMGYILIMFTYRAHVCKRACVSARVK